MSKIFSDPSLDAAIDDWDDLIRKRGLSNGEMMALLVIIVCGNLAMQSATPAELVSAFTLAVETLDPREVLHLCGVTLAQELPPHWRTAGQPS